MAPLRRTLTVACAAAPLLVSLVVGCARGTAETAPANANANAKAGITPLPPALEAPPEAIGGGPRDVLRPYAEATCSRAMRCGGSGPKGPFASEADCTEYVTDSGVDEIGIAVCGPGVDALKMQSCLDALRTQPCDESFTPAACRPAALCGR